MPVRKLERYPLQDLRRGAQLIYDVRANWKVIMENYNECYHCGPGAPGAVRARSRVPRARRRRPRLGRRHSSSRRRLDLHAERHIEPRAVPRAVGEGEDPSQGRSCYPNLLLSAAAEHIAAFTLWPTGPDHTRIACEFLFHPDEIAKAHFDPADVVEFWDVVNRQDWRICESVQDGMRSRGFRGGFYAPMEDPVSTSGAISNGTSATCRRWVEGTSA